MGQVVIAPSLVSLSSADLTEYLTMVSALIKNTELLFARLYLVDKECRAILDGSAMEMTPRLANVLLK